MAPDRINQAVAYIFGVDGCGRRWRECARLSVGPLTRGGVVSASSSDQSLFSGVRIRSSVCASTLSFAGRRRPFSTKISRHGRHSHAGLRFSVIPGARHAGISARAFATLAARRSSALAINCPGVGKWFASDWRHAAQACCTS